MKTKNRLAAAFLSNLMSINNALSSPGVGPALGSSSEKSPATGLISDPAIFASNLQSIQNQQNRYVSPLTTDAQAVMDMIGSTCTNNTDCDGSTFCCSQGRCVPGSICYKGQKQAYDHCEYGFECLSRCCASDFCSPVIQCVQTCEKNSDCGTEEPCCSFGYCTGSQSICEQGMKADFDMCEAASECQSGRCINSRCTSNEIEVTNQVSMNVMIVLVFLMLIIVVTTCYYSKVKSDQIDNYRRQRNRDESPTMTADGRDSRHRRRHRRSGSSSSAERHRRRMEGGLNGSGSDGDTMGGPSQRRGHQLSDSSHRRESSDQLSRENLDRLSRQANSVTPAGGHERQPALLFVQEGDQELMEQLGSSYMNTTNARSSDLIREASSQKYTNEASSQELAQAFSGNEAFTREKKE